MTRLPDDPEYQLAAPALVPRDPKADRRPAGWPQMAAFPAHWSRERPKRFKARSKPLGAIAVADGAVTQGGSRSTEAAEPRPEPRRRRSRRPSGDRHPNSLRHAAA